MRKPGCGEPGAICSPTGVRQAADALIEEIQMREDRSDQQRVQRLKAPLQRVARDALDTSSIVVWNAHAGRTCPVWTSSAL